MFLWFKKNVFEISNLYGHKLLWQSIFYIIENCYEKKIIRNLVLLLQAFIFLNASFLIEKNKIKERREFQMCTNKIKILKPKSILSKSSFP